MTGRHVEDVAGSDLALSAVIHLQRHAPLEHMTDVLDVAEIGPHERLDVF